MVHERLFGVAIAAAWGVSFPVSALALKQFPPFLLVSLRFALVALPTVVFVPFPRGKAWWVLATGLGIGLVQFGCLYTGMRFGAPAGVASLAIQSSAPVTVVLAGVLLSEKIHGTQWAGVALGVVGLTGLAGVQGRIGPILPLGAVVLGGVGWAFGNISIRASRALSSGRLFLWAATVPPIPSFLMSLMSDGWAANLAAFTTLGDQTGILALGALCYIGLIATAACFVGWSKLIAEHGASAIAPLSMLVPVVGMASSALMLGERFTVGQVLLTLPILTGVLLASRSGLRRHSEAIAPDAPG